MRKRENTPMNMLYTTIILPDGKIEKERGMLLPAEPRRNVFAKHPDPRSLAILYGATVASPVEEGWTTGEFVRPQAGSTRVL